MLKIGHGGTLDPLATGVLIAGIGKGTKELSNFLDCMKTYETVLLFGVATDTYDRVGKVVGHAPYEHITREKVEKALEAFRGKIMQRPPIFSALRVQGKRMYEYAREGKELPVEIQPRPVGVEKLEIIEWLEGGQHPHKWPEQTALPEDKLVAKKILQINVDDDTPSDADGSSKRKREADSDDELVFDARQSRRKKPGPGPVMSGGLSSSSPTSDSAPTTTAAPAPPSIEVSAPLNTSGPGPGLGPPAVRLRMTVSAGFYVRSLCHDLGLALDSLGIMCELVRTRQAGFELGKNVFEYDDLQLGEDVWGKKVEAMLDEWNEKKAAGKLH